MTAQRTIRNSFTLSGKGLHTGLDTNITFNPAPENHGYKIKRTDLKDQPTIDAIAENRIDSKRGIVLHQDGVEVSAIGHALAALYACEIDNCLIEVDGSEFPVLDGSSMPFVIKIKEIGFTQQKEERRYINFKRKKIKVVDKETGSSMILLPDENFSIQSQISYKSLLLCKQEAELMNLSDFPKEIASSRTFVFVHELEKLLQEELIKGGNLDNTIVIYDKLIPQEKLDQIADKMGSKRKDAKRLGYIMNKPLQYANEPARHKLLDIIGDIALVGYFIKGKILANCPGHKINNLFARAIRQNIKEPVLY